MTLRISILLALVAGLLTFSPMGATDAVAATPTLNRKVAYRNAMRIYNGANACNYRDRSLAFAANAYGRTTTGFTSPDSWKNFLQTTGRFPRTGTPRKGVPVFYITSGGGLVGIYAGDGKVIAPNTRGCLVKYPYKRVPGTWYHAWGRAAFLAWR